MFPWALALNRTIVGFLCLQAVDKFLQAKGKLDGNAAPPLNDVMEALHGLTTVRANLAAGLSSGMLYTSGAHHFALHAASKKQMHRHDIGAVINCRCTPQQCITLAGLHVASRNGMHDEVTIFMHMF